MILIFDHRRIDEVPQIRACIPSSIVGIHVNFPQFLDHFRLVASIGLGSRCSCREVRGGIVVVVSVRSWNFNGGEGEGVGNFEVCSLVHANEEARRSGRKGLRAVLYNFHHNLPFCQLGAF